MLMPLAAPRLLEYYTCIYLRGDSMPDLGFGVTRILEYYKYLRGDSMPGLLLCESRTLRMSWSMVISLSAALTSSEAG